MAAVLVTLSENDWERDAMTTEVEPEPIWRQRWDTCDNCGTSTVVVNEEGLKDPEEWDSFPGCMVCGGSLTMGNADEITTDEEWRLRLAELQKKLAPPDDDIKRIDIKEFRELGFLQEVNRMFLHPLGLALEVTVEEDGSEHLGGVWDYREDPEGMIFGDAMLDPEKQLNVDRERARHIPA